MDIDKFECILNLNPGSLENSIRAMDNCSQRTNIFVGVDVFGRHVDQDKYLFQLKKCPPHLKKKELKQTPIDLEKIICEENMSTNWVGCAQCRHVDPNLNTLTGCVTGQRS